jgi:hypothetical protein
MPDAKKPIKEDDLVTKIVSDPKNPPNTLLLTGFLGKSSDAGHVRLYLNEELSDYVDIPETAILHIEEMSKGESPLGGNYVWIQRDAQLVYGPVTAAGIRGSFLEGRIQQQFLPAAPAAAAIPRPFTSTDPACTEFGPRCPTTVGPRCTQFGPRCRTDFLPCPTDIGPAPLCPDTVSDPRCPPHTAPDPRCPPVTVPDPRCPPTVPDPRCPPPPPTTVGPRCTQFGPRCRTDFLPCPTEVGPRCTRFGPVCF